MLSTSGRRGLWRIGLLLVLLAPAWATLPAPGVQAERLSAATRALLDQNAVHGAHMAQAAAGNGSSLRFNGTNQYVEVADATALRIPVNLTLEAWIKPTGVSGHRHIAGKNNYEISVEPATGGFKAKFEFSRGGSWIEVASGAYPLNEWHHIAGIYDGSNMRLFVNGSRVGTTQTSGTVDQTGNPFRIGSADASGDFFIGFIDEVRLSNVVRYTGNFVTPRQPFSADSSTVGLWQFDDGMGNVAVDASANGLNGTLIAGPAWSTDVPYSGPDQQPPAINNVAASNLTTSGATIGWTTDEAATSKVEYGTTTGYGQATPLDGALVATHSQTLSGLAPETTYQYRVVSSDAAGNTATSGNFSFTTPANNPPPAPVISNVASGNITTSSAAITWVTDVASDSQVEYGTSAAYGQSTALVPAMVTAHSVTISGLAANTTYHYRVKSKAANGALAVSGDGIFSTGTTSAATSGQWSPALNWPLVAVHNALLPNGNVLMWDAWELKPNVAARMWNPQSQQFTGVTNEFSSIFCSGHSFLGDGRLLVAGGFVRDGYGIKDTNLFNPANNTWTRVADMGYERWYPTTTALADGRIVVLGGAIAPGVEADLPEVYNPANNTWTVLTNARANVGEYPHANLLPDGKVFVIAGPDYRSRTLDVATQQWTTIDTAPIPTGSSVQYRPGKFLAAGGGSPNVDPVTRGAAVIDMNAATPAWRNVGSMAGPRFQHNLLVLPDGKVLAVGGSTIYSLVATQGTKTAELWDPATESWSTMASMRDPRMYHSTSLLLPDGRVLVAGGGRIAPADDYLTAEIYSPPYLFKGARPTITSAPGSANYGTTFTVQTPDAADIAGVALVRNGSNTHTVSHDQRYVPLTFTKSSGSLQITMPPAAATAPPGDYMLFVTNSAGVPSVAPIVRVGGQSQADTQAPSTSITAPNAGATVSGSAVAVTANAVDNVGVTGVQFLLDGQPLGASDTSAPYSVQWNTTTAANGTHTLGAQARDAAGNVGAAQNVSVTVSNTTVDTTPPVITGVAASSVGSTSATIVWTTNEPATQQVEYGTTTAYGSITALDTALTTGHTRSLVSLTPSTTYHYRVISRDAAGNTASSGNATFQTTAPSAVTLLGETTVKNHVDYNDAGMAEAFQYTAGTAGTANKLWIFVDNGSTATKLVVGLYTNTRDEIPGALLAQATLNNPTKNAWNSVSISPVTTTAGTKYWIAVLGPAGSGILRFRDVECCGKAQTSAQSNLTILPATWSRGANYNNSPMSAYAQQAP